MHIGRHLFLGFAIATAGLFFFAGSVWAGGQLAVVERAASDTVTDIGAKGDSVGDVLTFANEIYDQTNKTLVGHDNGWCVRTAVGQSWECFWTTLLDKGQITVEGPYYDTKDSVLAITGGTGAYATVRGEMKLHARNDKGTEYDFVFDMLDAQ
jgi:allene oxide cyclase